MASHSRHVGFLHAVVLAGSVLLGAIPSLAERPPEVRGVPKSDKPRFAITDRTWPSKPGEAQICLWQGDKLAAVSVTIDDNMVQDHAWWLDTSQKYGYKLTWFVISRHVRGMNDPFGSWDHFRKLLDAGQDVQSHSADHFHPRDGSAALPAEENYRQSLLELEKNLPGHTVRCLAYPGGPLAKNDPAQAAKYFIAARGTRGHMNPANLVDYNETASISGVPDLNAESRVGLPNLITLNPQFKMNYRGWCSMHFHGMENPKATPPDEAKIKTLAMFEYLKAHDDAFWVAPFTFVAMYGQERDTATLTAAPAEETALRYTLKDTLDDALFAHPLTLKIRLPDAWSTAAATQGDKAIPARVVQHDGSRFVLLEARPDNGEIRVRQAEAAGDGRAASAEAEPRKKH